MIGCRLALAAALHLREIAVVDAVDSLERRDIIAESFVKYVLSCSAASSRGQVVMSSDFNSSFLSHHDLMQWCYVAAAATQLWDARRKFVDLVQGPMPFRSSSVAC